jgi:hypothetical protein
MISLIIMLTPWSPRLPADQIWMGNEIDPIQAEVFELPQGRRFAVRAHEWVQLKRRAEASSGYCQDAVTLATQVCTDSANKLLTQTRTEAEQTAADQSAVINALRVELDVERANLERAKQTAERLKWVAIGAGVVAVSAGVTVAVTR